MVALWKEEYSTCTSEQASEQGIVAILEAPALWWCTTQVYICAKNKQANVHAYLLGDGGDLDVGVGYLLLHDLLEDLEGQVLRLRQAHIVPELVLQGRLRALRARADRLRLELEVAACSRG